MKTLKFVPEQISLILSGQHTSTWRLVDEKDIQVNDILQLVNSENGFVFAKILVDEVTTKRISAINEQDMQNHKKYVSNEEILADFRKYYGSRITQGQLVKIIRFHLLNQKDIAIITTKVDKVKLFTDGGSRGNPGPSASGFVIYDDQDAILSSGGEYLGITTNNQAEYQAVRHGLRNCQSLGANSVRVFMDSLLVVNQMNGVFKIRNRELWPIHSEIKELMEKFKKVSFVHVPRELNKAADYEVNRILDENKKLSNENSY